MYALLFAAMLAAPGAAPGAPATTLPAQPGAQPEQPPLSIWRPVDGGAVEHLQSGLRCPETLGAFRRTQATAFDSFGVDVGCGYNSATASVTVYMTRAPNVDAAFESAKASVIQAQARRNPRLVSERRDMADGLDWRRAEFTLDGVTHSDIWLTDLHGWQFKYRTTYPSADAGAVAEALTAATAAARASAGAHLAACAKSPPPSRPGKVVKFKAGGSDPRLLASLIGAAGAGKAADRAPPRFNCLEDGVATGGKGFLFWRAVTPDGQDAQADRLTVMTVTAPLALEVYVDSVGNAVAGELSGGKAAGRWIATMNNGTQTAVYGYFDERPPMKVLAPLMVDILDGKARAIGGLSADGKTINVTLPSR